jgi:hypothetical protein
MDLRLVPSQLNEDYDAAAQPGPIKSHTGKS